MWPLSGSEKVPCLLEKGVFSKKGLLADIQRVPRAKDKKNPADTKSLRSENLMGMGVFQQKEAKIPGAHKIGAAISGSRIAGGGELWTLGLLRSDSRT